MRFLILGGSVGLKNKTKQEKPKRRKNHKKFRNRTPGTPASLLWSLEKTRDEPKINMAKKLVDVIVK